MDRSSIRNERDRLPLGVLAAILFLRVSCIAMLLPIAVAGVASLLSFGDVYASRGFLFRGVIFGSFLAMTAMALGCDWLARHLRAAATSEWDTPTRRPDHPVRHILLLPLVCLMAYALLAVMAWLPSIGERSPAITWPWLVAWIAIGFGAMYLLHLLDKKLP